MLLSELTQEALAECAYLSVPAITDLERGINRAPCKAPLQLLAIALFIHRAATLHRDLGAPLPGRQADVQHTIDAIRAMVPEDDWHAAWARGSSLRLNDVIAYILKT